MSEKLKAAGTRFLLCVFPAAGLLIAVLRIAGSSACLVPALSVQIVWILFLEANRNIKKLRLPSLLIVPAAFVAWLAFGQGLPLLVDMIRAVYLALSGVSGALEIVAFPLAIALALLTGAGWFAVTEPACSPYIALCLTGVEFGLLWLADTPELLLCALPAFLVVLPMICSHRHKETSLKATFPFLAVIVLIAFIPALFGGLEAPLLKEKADRLRQEIMDRLFFTEPRYVFSLSAEGYYPQGQSQLGGPVFPGDHRVMDVSTSRTTYLRGAVLNEYDGRSWKNTTGGRRYLWDLKRWEETRTALFDQDLPGGKLNDGSGLMQPRQVTVRMLEDTASTLFVPQRADSFNAGGDLVLYFNPSSEVFATRNLKAGDTYTVTGRLFTSDDAGLATLVNAAASLRDDRWETVVSTYTALPSHLEQPVYDLAASVTDSHETMYDKAFAIQTWLSRNYRYRLDTALQPADLDFVTNFLLNTREGYCTYFASAMTILCRMVGLPARYVEGYVAHPDENGHAIVTGKNAHAWTEVYFKGFGWVTFDATPGHLQSGVSDTPNQNRQDAGPDDSLPDANGENAPEGPDPSDTDPKEPEAPENDPEDPVSDNKIDDPFNTPPEENPETDQQNQPASDRSDTFPWLLLLPPILLAAFCLYRVLRAMPRAMEKRTETTSARWEVYENAILDLLHVKNIRRNPDQSPVSWFESVDRSGVFDTGILPVAVTRSFRSYAGKEPGLSDLEAAKGILDRVLRSQPFPCRIRWVLYRAFRFDSARLAKGQSMSV